MAVPPWVRAWVLLGLDTLVLVVQVLVYVVMVVQMLKTRCELV